MTKQITVDPAFHGERVQECVAAFNSGKNQEAMTLAMMAGVNAGYMKMDFSDCPFKQPGHLEFQLQWEWGYRLSASVNDNLAQGNLL